MNEVIARLLSAVRLGEPIGEAGWTFVPVFSSLAEGPAYVTLAEATAAGDLTVEEVDSDGRVPQLRARNAGKTGVLILDGEELKGAKQNRVLNTTVYLPPGSDVIIPVSCVEAGRWSMESSTFSDSGYVAAARVRYAAKRSVTANLRTREGFESDQGCVWRAVDDLAQSHGVESRTSAMRDVFERRRENADAIARSVPVQDGQCGLIAQQAGRVCGMDVVSRAAAYAVLHERIVRSYAYETIRRRRRSAADELKTAGNFLVDLSDADATTHRSPGAGAALRFTAHGFIGDALTYRGAILHAAFFTTGAEHVAGEGVTAASCRKGFRLG